MKLSGNISIDWLSFTLSYSDEMMTYARSLGKGFEYEELNYGRFRYNQATRMLDGAHIYYNSSRKEMGIHVAINSASLAVLDYRPLQLINLILDWGGRFTRIDLAFDDFDDLLNPDRMYVKILRGEVATRYRSFSRILGGKVGKQEINGDTVNLGSRSSESFIRIYDKYAEQTAKGVQLPDGIKTWVRVELEVKGEKAEAVSRLMGETALSSSFSAAQEVANILYGLLDFKEVSETDTNKSRWETSDWWLEFIQATAKRKLSLPAKERSIEHSKVWLKNQVSTTLAMIILAENDNNGMSGWDFVVECAVEGEAKINRNQQKLLDEYNEKQRHKQKHE